MKTKIFYWLLNIVMIIGTAGLVNQVGATSYADTCQEFYEDFSGLSANAFDFNNGVWQSTDDGWLCVSQITPDKEAYAATAFQPSDYFHLDVDFLTMPNADDDNDFIDVFVSTANNAPITVAGRTVDEIGVLYYPFDGYASIYVWDQNASRYIYLGDDFRHIGSVQSIGFSFHENGVTLRLNGQNTSLTFTGTLANAYSSIVSLSVGARQEAAQICFDNICAGWHWFSLIGVKNILI